MSSRDYARYVNGENDSNRADRARVGSSSRSGIRCNVRSTHRRRSVG